MPYAPRATFDNPYGPQITFRTEDVLPPTALYISPEDQVTVWLVTDNLAQTINLQMRLLMPMGEIKLIPYNFIPQSTYTWYAGFEVPPWEGYLLGAMCWSTNPKRGQTYVSVQVMRSLPPNMQSGGVVLLQGYVNQIAMLSYPTSPLESTFSGRGAFLTKTLPNQNGANLVFNVPAFTMWRVCSLNFTLSTTAAAAPRVVAIVVKDSSGVQVGFWSSAAQQPASSNWLYGFSPDGATSSAGSFVSIAGPTELFIPEQGSLQTYIVGLDAGDGLGNIGMLVEEWMGH